MDINTEKEEVRFSSNRLKLGDGELDEVLEARLRFEFDSRLSYRPVRKYKKAGDVPDKGLRVTRVMQARQADRTVKDAHVGNGNGRDGEAALLGRGGRDRAAG